MRNHAIASTAVAIALLLGTPLHAQSSTDAAKAARKAAKASSAAASTTTPPTSQIPCPRPQQPLVKIPEVASKVGRLRATVIATSEFDRVGERQPGNINGGAAQPGDPNAYTA